MNKENSLLQKLLSCIRERRLPCRLQQFLNRHVVYQFSKNPNRREYWNKKFQNLESEKWREEIGFNILEFLPQDERFTLLDIGCALGDTCILIKKKFPKSEISGCDFSNIAIEKAKEKAKEIEFFILNILKDDIPKKYDYIIIISLLEHFDNPLPVIDKCLKKINKYLIIDCPYAKEISYDPKDEHRFAFNEKTLEGRSYNYKYFIKPDIMDNRNNRIIYVIGGKE